jgi:hypothetical protein
MMIGVGEALHSHGDMVVFMVASTEVITTHGDGTVSDMDMAGTTGAGEATVGAVTITPTSIPLIDTTPTIPVAGSATITIIEITLIALAGEVSTTLIPTLGALPLTEDQILGLLTEQALADIEALLRAVISIGAELHRAVMLG